MRIPCSGKQQNAKNLAGIPAFVCEFINVSEAVPCPACLHTSESDQRTIEPDNSTVFAPVRSAKALTVTRSQRRTESAEVFQENTSDGLAL